MKSYFTLFVSLLICSMVPAVIFSTYFIILSIADNSLSTIFKQLPSLFFFTTAFGFMHAMLLGFPLYLLVKKYSKFTFTVSATGGFIVGALPLSIYAWPFYDYGSSSTINGVKTVVNGVPTKAGWFNYFQDAFILGVIGLVSGVVFKYVLSRFKASNNTLNKDATSVAPIS